MSEHEKKKLIVTFIMRCKSYKMMYYYEFHNFLKSFDFETTRLYDLSIEQLEIIANRISDNLRVKWQKSEEKQRLKSDE